jgi:hypothetical protein
MVKLLTQYIISMTEYNYFINCTACGTINDFPKTNKMAERYFKHKCEMKLDENTNKGTKICFNKRTKWKYEQKHQILVECLAGLDFGDWRENMISYY